MGPSGVGARMRPYAHLHPYFGILHISGTENSNTRREWRIRERGEQPAETAATAVDISYANARLILQESP